MQASLEKNEGLKRKLTISFPSADLEQEIGTILKKRAKTAKIDGFRPGKAPMDLVEKYYRSAAFEQAFDRKVSETLVKAFEQEKVEPVNRPEVNILDPQSEQEIRFEASFEVAPEVSKVEFNGEIEKIVSEVGDADVEQVITNLRKQFGSFEPVDDAAKEEDKLVFDFKGFINDEAFAGGEAKNFELVLGSKQMIPGFEEALLGAKPGDSRVINVTFPENYHADLAGKEAKFETTVHRVLRMVPAELNDQLFKKLGVKEGGLEKLQAEIRKTLTRELNKMLDKNFHEKIFDRLLELNAIDVPGSVVHDEIHQLMHEAEERFASMYGMKKDQMPKFPHDMFEPQALRRVRLAYLVRALIKLNDLKADQTAIRQAAEELAESYENPAKVVQHYLGDKKLSAELANYVLEGEVVKLLAAKANVKDKKVPYADVSKVINEKPTAE